MATSECILLHPGLGATPVLDRGRGPLDPRLSRADPASPVSPKTLSSQSLDGHAPHGDTPLFFVVAVVGFTVLAGVGARLSALFPLLLPSIAPAEGRALAMLVVASDRLRIG
jgi:hypothetical protein